MAARRHRAEAPFSSGSPAFAGNYCFKIPQYFCAVPTQQPVFMQYAFRLPQLVTQAAIVERSGFLPQAVMQVFCSELHRMGVAGAGPDPSRTSQVNPAEAIIQPDRHARRESVCGCMQPS